MEDLSARHGEIEKIIANLTKKDNRIAETLELRKSLAELSSRQSKIARRLSALTSYMSDLDSRLTAMGLQEYSVLSKALR